MVVEKDEELMYSTQCAISILSGSRFRLYNLCKNITNMEVIYSDIDSIFVTTKSVQYKKFKNGCGEELGKLDDTIGNKKHGIINRILIGWPIICI